MASDDTVIPEVDFEFDPSLEELTGVKPPEPGERVAVIRTSDRTNFRRCRRKWGWSSHLRQNLAPIEAASPLWFGSGFHYALEDFHGPHNYAKPVEAFNDYVRATHAQAKAKGNPRLMPFDWVELTLLGRKMLEYYTDYWLIGRDPLQTFIYKGRPQVEVHVLMPVPIRTPHFDRVYYAATLDRVVVHNNGLFIVDYKTAKQIQTHFFQTDPQISAYCWIAQQLYGQPIKGFIYQQHRKRFPEDPRVLADGTISTASGQATSHRHYRRSLLNLYGSPDKFPTRNVDFLNQLAHVEEEHADPFIRRSFVYRNQHQCEAEGVKLLLELEDMLNPNIPLYPNPTRDCGHLCAFNSPCVDMDDGSDFEETLRLMYTPKDDAFDSWRDYLPPERKEPCYA